MATAVATTPKLTQGQVASLLGRNQGPEFFYQQAWTPLDTVQVPKNVNLNRPLERFHIIWQGRITIAGADMASVFPEGLQSLIQQFKLNGTHQKYGALVPIQLSGADIFAWPGLFRSRGCSLYINGVRVNPLGIPAGLPLGTFGAIGSYDVEIHYDIPLEPVTPAAAKLNCVPFLYMQSDWQDTLNIQLTMGDASSLGIQGGGGTATFHAFGQDTGSPQFKIYSNYEILGALANKLTTAVVIRAVTQVPAGNINAPSANLVKLAQLQKYKTLNVVLKSGSIATGTSPGVTTWSVLSDSIFDLTQILVDNKPIRNNLSNAASKEYVGYAFDTVEPQGYLPFSFMDSLNPRTAFPGDKVSGGSTYELDSQIVAVLETGNAAEMVQEYFQGVPSGSN